MPKFVTKNARFAYFWAGIWKYYYHIWNQRPRICLVAKFGGKIKILKFGTKNAWFGYLWTGTWKQYCHIYNQHSQICLISKFREIMKMHKFGTNNALLGYFWAMHLKKLLSYLNSAPSNLPNCKILQKNKNAWIWEQKRLIWAFLG